MSIKNDGHYFCRAGGNRPDGLNEPVTDHLKTLIAKGANQCARAGDKLPDLLDEYIRATTE
ncbi:hypothetical protein F7F12_29825 [Escherichia coli]|nr:hypothetical protein F7F12_29825 [Escherichia coli]